jgi:SAM-dependent methyltransferase
MIEKKGLWLNLGCSNDLLNGFINVDILSAESIDKKFDYEEADLTIVPWPWITESVDFILAKDIIEHLPNKIVTMNEIWRVLKPGAIAQIEVPTTDGPGAFQDPTHVSYWNRNSFFYYEDGNPHRERFGYAYGIRARFSIVHFHHDKLQDNVTKLSIFLKAVK